MKIIFISNFLNPHQYPVAKALYKMTDGEYRFVELESMPDSFRQSGYPDYDKEPWLIKAWRSEDLSQEADTLVLDADVVIAGGCAAVEPYIDKRLKLNKLTFKYTERWFKRGLLNLLSPNIFKPVLSYHLKHRKKPYYLLCASAFSAYDANIVGTFKDKAYKWGYFPKTGSDVCDEDIFKIFREPYPFRIMTVCRMLDWKQPEMMVKAAKYLHDNKVEFIMDMYGSGERMEVVRSLIKKYDLEAVVSMRGNISNEKIHEEMQNHHCLLFTSNKREGWGAVVNEAMANGCTVVGASKIGAVPYLIKNRYNGIVFKDGDQNDLNNKLLELTRNVTDCERLARKARETITILWSPEEAAKRIIKLSESILHGEMSPYMDGPCSIA
ncbi:glycosyltransferase [uncultured Duncaniella sp.]|uniref:glycosyltransferase n=1 Tax=uncultured Duncaniella sp. TaxID=2768039 RepID=UPI00267492FB|nr:glycosyltransferase [uncultured Duncaniella sp.]